MAPSAHARQLRLADDLFRFRGKHEMQRDDVGAGEEVVDGNGLHACSRGLVGGHAAAPGDDIHTERPTIICKVAADQTQSEDAERFSCHAKTRRDIFQERAALDGGIAFRNAADGGKHKRQGVFGGILTVFAAARDRDNNATTEHLVQTPSPPAGHVEEFETGQAGDDIVGKCGALAHRQDDVEIRKCLDDVVRCSGGADGRIPPLPGLIALTNRRYVRRYAASRPAPPRVSSDEPVALRYNQHYAKALIILNYYIKPIDNQGTSAMITTPTVSIAR